MNELPILTSIFAFLLFLAIVWAIIKMVRFFVGASRRKYHELSKLAHEAEGIKDGLNAQK